MDLTELRRRTHDKQGIVPFDSDDVFDEADACSETNPYSTLNPASAKLFAARLAAQRLAATMAEAARLAATMAEAAGDGTAVDSSDDALAALNMGGCGDFLLDFAELNAWAMAAHRRGRQPSVAREGSLRSAPLIDLDGTNQKEISHRPAAGSCAEAVFSACPGQ
jgi:hypothetical protein